MTNNLLPRFHRKELVLGSQLDYGSSATKFFEIQSVHLREKKPEHPVREDVAKNTHRYAAMLISDANIDEAALLSNLSHDHLLSVKAYYVTNAHVLLVVERILCTLADCLEQWSSRAVPPPLLERLYVIQHIAAALNYLHNNDIIFRDVNPESIGFDMEGNLKLFDFGLARKLENELSSSKPLIGENMAPEVVMGKQYNMPADVFGFTLVFWELLMLIPADSNQPSKYISLMKESGWPLWAQDIIVHGLCSRSEQRTNMKDIQACLRKVVREEERKERLRKKSLFS